MLTSFQLVKAISDKYSCPCPHCGYEIGAHWLEVDPWEGDEAKYSCDCPKCKRPIDVSVSLIQLFLLTKPEQTFEVQDACQERLAEIAEADDKAGAK